MVKREKLKKSDVFEKLKEGITLCCACIVSNHQISSQSIYVYRVANINFVHVHKTLYIIV